MVLARPAEQGPAWMPVDGSKCRIRDAFPGCPKHKVGKGKGAMLDPRGSIAPPARPSLFFSWHGVFLRRAVESLPGPAPLPRWGACHQKKPFFCWKEAVGRALQSDGWSGPFPLQAAWGAGTEPGKGFLMRRYDASLLSIVAGHN